MEQTEQTETGWTREYPKERAFYFVRTEQYRELPAEFDGQTVSGLYGTRFFPDDLAHHHPEFLGPFTASNVEQLVRLRNVVREYLTIDPANDVTRWCELERELEQLTGVEAEMKGERI